jgi:hypothetical protein
MSTSKELYGISITWATNHPNEKIAFVGGRKLGARMFRSTLSKKGG